MLRGSALREAKPHGLEHLRAAAEALRRHHRSRQADDAGDGERELRSAPRTEPAGEQPPERARAVEGIEVEADDAAAQPVWRGQLQ